jgi:hypothetical protein
MNSPDNFSQYHAELLDGIYDCVERIVLNAFYPWGRPAVACAAGGEDFTGTTRNWMTSICARWQAHSPAACTPSAPNKGFPSSRRDPGSEGTSWPSRTCPRIRPLAACSGDHWQCVGADLGSQPQYRWQITEIRHRKKWPFVKHYHFHIMDREWGHVTIRMCGYPPFGAQLILNGHEWVEREARRKCLTTVKNGNCFVEGSDFAAVNRVAAQLHQENAIGRLRELCEQWVYSTCLCFALTHEEQKRIGFAYQYSVFQLELSRNLLFLRGTTMNAVYQRLISALARLWI